MLHILLSLIKLLPNYDKIKVLISNETEAAYIFQKAIINMQRIANCNENMVIPFSCHPDTEETYYLIQCLTDKFWERIHTGHFSQVPEITRKIYAVASFFKIFYMLFQSDTPTQMEKCSAVLDDAMLVGITQNLYDESNLLIEELTKLFDLTLNSNSNNELPILKEMERQIYKCDIEIYDCPSISSFKQSCFQNGKPALLLNTITHWPALEKWRDLNYIDKIAGNRTVPIEIGSNYTTDDWSQQIVKVRDFLRRQFATSTNIDDVEYLAQHELFDQIPALKADIRIPDYCTLGEHGNEVDIKAWLGPKGTVSPLHYDPKHNFLCQIFGIKYVILAAPEDTQYLYPHATEFLSNTSQIDADKLNFEDFPLCAKVRFYNVTLQPGDCLYMPPKWWHYVKAKSESFSVSFWWE